MVRSFLASPNGVILPVREPAKPFLRIDLESLDGSIRLPLDGSRGYTQMPGSTGLRMAPVDVMTQGVPGVYGSTILDTRIEERRIFIPLFIGNGAGTHVEHMERLDLLRSIIDPLSGAFRIVAVTERGERELTATYTGGLEGDDDPGLSGIIWDKVGLTAVAVQPFASDREDRSLEFRVAEAGGFLIGAVGGTDAPWPTALSSTTVIGSGMQVNVGGELPVYPTLTLTGPMSSFRGTMAALPSGAVWDVNIPAGVPSGSTLRLVTDPRGRSIRLDGALAAGSVARGSSLRAFMPGTNTLNVTAPGGTSATSIIISWREQYRSLW